MKPFGIVYGLYDPRDGRLRYIGQTVRTMKVRVWAHLTPSSFQSSLHSSRWIAKLRRLDLYPTAKQLGVAYSRAELDALEVRLIAEARLRKDRLTNLADGGGGRAGYKHRPSTKRKMSAAAMGHRMSVESRAKVSRGNKGRKRSEAVKAKMSKAALGNTHSLGNKATSETRAKMSARHKGLMVGSKHSHYRHDISTDAILERLRSGVSRRQLSEELGVTPKLLSRRLFQADRAGVLGVPKSTRARAIPTEAILSKLGEGRTWVETAEELGISVPLVALRLRQWRSAHG